MYQKDCLYINSWCLVINQRLMTRMDVTDYMQVNCSVAVSWLLCNPIHLIRMLSFAIKQPLLLFLNQRTMSLIWFNRQQWCWIKSPKKGLNARNVVRKKIEDGSYFPSNWNQPISRDQLSKNHFKWIREGWLTSLLRITTLCFSTKVINWQLHFILLHAGLIACRQLLHHLHSMLNTACQQNRSEYFFVHTCSV